jgi:hypothetical protein
MLPDCLRSKKIKNVCGEKKVPILPCENKVIRSKSSPQPILTPALSKGEGEKKERELNTNKHRNVIE